MKTRFDHITDDLQKYSYISNLRDRNETLFYRLVMDNIDEMGTRSAARRVSCVVCRVIESNEGAHADTRARL